MRVIAVLVLVAGCAHQRPRATFASDDVYAQVATLQSEGQVTIAHTSTGHPVVVRRDQILETTDHQQYAVAAIIDRCTGAVPEEAECTLAALAGLTFVVHDESKIKPLPSQEPDAPGLSARWKAELAGLAIAAPLTYGVAACSFSGCKALFGLPLALDGLFMIVMLVGFG